MPGYGFGYGYGLNQAVWSESDFLIDRFPATAAYSLRALSSTTTNVVRVREDGSNTEQDFTAKEITDGTLATFCGANNGFVVTWYDQAGSNNATQATAGAQPKVYDSITGVMLENGKPAVDFDGVDDLMTATITGMQNFTNLSLFTTITPDLASAADTTTQVVFGYADGGASAIQKGVSCGGTTALLSGETICSFFSGDTSGRLGSTTYTHSAGEQLLHSQFYLNTGTSLYKNGAGITLDLNITIDTATDTSPANSGAASDLFHIASLNGVSSPASQKVQEMIVYGSDQSANRTAIESNINSHYSIYP